MAPPVAPIVLKKEGAIRLIVARESVLRLLLCRMVIGVDGYRNPGTRCFAHDSMPGRKSSLDLIFYAGDVSEKELKSQLSRYTTSLKIEEMCNEVLESTEINLWHIMATLPLHHLALRKTSEMSTKTSIFWLFSCNCEAECFAVLAIACQGVRLNLLVQTSIANDQRISIFTLRQISYQVY
jgi:hypothetical protein